MNDLPCWLIHRLHHRYHHICTVQDGGGVVRKHRDLQYMMATTAHHKTGDISRDEPDLCIIYGETDDAFIGEWVTGFGLIEVNFPKETTRLLTREEVEQYSNRRVRVADQPSMKLSMNERGEVV